MFKNGDEMIFIQFVMQLEDLIGKFLVNGLFSDKGGNKFVDGVK